MNSLQRSLLVHELNEFNGFDQFGLFGFIAACVVLPCNGKD